MWLYKGFILYMKTNSNESGDDLISFVSFIIFSSDMVIHMCKRSQSDSNVSLVTRLGFQDL